MTDNKSNQPHIYWDSTADEYQRRTSISCDDFHYGPLIPGESELKLLPDELTGMRALELGCGAARNSIWLCRRGAQCTAVDSSAEQLRHARTITEKHQDDIKLIQSDIEKLSTSVEGPFDIIHSSNALQFTNSPDAVIENAVKLLAPGGLLLISVPHPLFSGEWLELDDDESGLFITDYFNPPADIREDQDGIRVVSRSYPLSQWCRWLISAGLQITRIEEPMAAKGSSPYSSPDWEALREQLSLTPSTLIISCRKSCS